MSVQGGPDIVENGLILCYDPTNIESYVSGSTTMYDLSTTGNTASLVGGVEYTGSFKGVFNFDGMNDYINIARPASISTSGSFSICMFAKWKTAGTTTSSIQTLLDNNHNSSPVQGFVIQDRPELSKKLSFSVRPDQLGAVSSFYVGNNNWYHITGTHDGTVSRLYINGVLDGFASQSGGISTVQPDINIGRWQNAGSRYFTGSIGQVLVYNRALSLAEVQQNYNTIKFRYPSPPDYYPPDPYFEYVTLLLRGEGINGGQNNTFLDSGPINYTISKRGNVAQGTFTPFGNRWSNYFDGTGDFLSIPDNAAFDMGTGDFTIECWVYIDGNSALNGSSLRDAAIFGCYPTGGSISNSYGLFIAGNGTTTGTGLVFETYQSGTRYPLIVTTTVTQNKWHHIAVARSGTTTKLFLDGVEVGSGTLGNQTVNSAYNITIGRIPYSTYEGEFKGYISNLRLLKGTAVYTSNFTPPTAPLTAIANTSLLTCQGNRFYDASSNNFTVTRGGNTIVTKFNPFPLDRPYTAEIDGGSARFYGYQDGLSIADNTELALGNSNFTIEGWVYNDNYDTRAILIGNGWSFYKWNDDLMFRYTVGGVGLSLASAHPRGRWVHFATVRDGSTLRLYFNGVQVNSTALTSALDSAAGVARIGDEGSNNCFNGWVSSTRIIIGTCLYPSGTTFTVPTSPFSVLPNTILLLNFTNGSILDSSMNNSLETAGNAQISTSIKKYGNGSIYFDGTGDYLNTWFGDNSNAGGSGIVIPSQFTFSGDFTIEAWVYVVAGGANRGIITFGDRATSTGLSLYWGSSTKFVLYGNGAQILDTVSGLSLNTWAHIAVTRSGTGVNNIKMYLNGVYQNMIGTANNTVFAGSSANHVCVGISYNSATFIEPHNGYIDDLRITNGIARYTGTGNFDPPAALPYV
jgi:hypothetical protein